MDLIIPDNPPLTEEGVIAWINETLDATDEKSGSIDSLQKFVLALRSQNVSTTNDIESLSKELASAIVPAVTEVQKVTDEANSIKDMLETLVQSVERLEGGSEDPLEEIAPLHQAKIKMVAMASTIQEIENWNAKLETIEAVFETHDVDKIGKEVAALHQSSLAFRGLSDFEERLKELGALKDRVEVVANPRLLAAMDAQDKRKIQQMVELFASIDRQSSVMDYFLRSRLEKVVRIARKFTDVNTDDGKETDEDKEENEARILEWLPLLFTEILTVIRGDVQWALDAFATSDKTIVNAYITKVSQFVGLKILSKLDDFFKNYRTNDIQATTEVLPRAFDVCMQFARAIASLRPKPLTLAEQEEEDKRRKRATNGGEGDSKDDDEEIKGLVNGRITPRASPGEGEGMEGGGGMTTSEVIHMLMGPLLKAEGWQHEMEGESVPSTRLLRQGGKDVESLGGLLDDWIKQTTTWIERVLERCILVTGGTRGPEMVDMVDSALQKELKTIGILLKKLGDEQAKLEEKEADDDDDTEEPTTNWAFLSHTFKILNHINEIGPALDASSTNLRNKLREALDRLLDTCPSEALSQLSNAEKKQDTKAGISGLQFADLVYQTMVVEDMKRLHFLRQYHSTLSIPRADAEKEDKKKGGGGGGGDDDGDADGD